MIKVPDNVAYCVLHGWTETVSQAEIIPGVFVPICQVCADQSKGGNA